MVIICHSDIMVTFLCLVYCNIFYLLWCILYIVIYLCIVVCMNSRCLVSVVSGGTCVGLMYKFLSTLLRLVWLSAWYSVPDVLHSTPGIMRVYWQCYMRIPLCVTQGWELSGSWYRVIWRCRVWYVCHMLLLTVCHATRCPQINTPTHLQQLLLS